jgi:HSF-type DNA-binding
MGEEGFLIGVQEGIDEGPVPISSSSSLDSLPVMDVQSSSSDSSTNHGLSDTIGTGTVVISSSNSSLLLEASKQLPQHAHDYQSQLLLPATIRSSAILPAPGRPPAASGRVQQHLGSGVGIHPEFVGSASAPLLAAASAPPTQPNSAATTTTTHSSAPEFLYQLTKMLSDNTNRDTIEWSNGRIEVHSPHRLETQVLNKYFRHSKVS